MDRPSIYPFARRRGARDVEPGNRHPGRVIALWIQPWRMVLGRIDWKAFLLALSALIMGRSFLLGEILPFAPAFLAAFWPQDKRRGGLLLIMALIGMATIARGWLFWGNLAVFVLVAIVFSSFRFDGTHWLTRPAVAAAVVFGAKSMVLLLSQLSVYRETVVGFEALIAAVLTFVFTVARQTFAEQKAISDYNLEDGIAVSVFGIGLIMGISDLYFFGLSLTGILGRCSILAAAYFTGAAGAVMVAVAAAVIPSVATVTVPKGLAVFAAAGLLSGLFRIFGRPGVILGFIVGDLLLSVFITGPDQLVSGLWETGVAILLFIPLSYLFDTSKTALPFFGHRVRGRRPDQVEAHVREISFERMNGLAKVFDEIAMTFAADEPAPDQGQEPETHRVGSVFQAMADNFCQPCALFRTCWENEFYHTYRDFFNLFSLAEMRGRVEHEDIPVSLRKRCVRPRELATAVNGAVATARVTDYWEERLAESKVVLARQLRGVGGVIRNLAKEIGVQEAVDWDLQELVNREGKKAGIPVVNIVPLRKGPGEVVLKVTADECSDRDACETMIAPGLSGLLGERFEVSQRKCPRDGKGLCEFTLARSFRYQVTCGLAQLAREEVSGDSLSIATLKDGRELIVVSDGMGVGKLAARESRATVNLLEEMFHSGFAPEIALRTVNAVLMLRNSSESFSTVDLALINLYSGEVDFVKIGAVPSFLKRGRRVGVVASDGLPLGVFEDIEFPAEHRIMMPGDMLVMVTDGVLDTGEIEEEREGWLRRYLSETDEDDPQKLAEMITNLALGRARGKPRDDMTVVCAHLEPHNE
ncbi:MAG: stage II sporulation protein E [Solirubrobacterales bacterium]